MNIGSHQLRNNVFVAPMAGVTDRPFRQLCKRLGAGYAVSEMAASDPRLLASVKTARRIDHAGEMEPKAVQIAGADPAMMADAARFNVERGAQVIDINMGCPVKKVVKIGGGSAMMTELDKTAALVRGMIAAVKIPVTAKMRLGWDDDNLTAPDLARVLEDSGVAAIFVHGRTRAQGFSGTVNLAGIRAVVQAVKAIPVIGNGDVTTPEAAKHMLDETGCAGVSIGRGAFYDPWIFRRTAHYLATGELLSEPNFAERVRVMRRHFSRYCDFYGEEHGARLFRKVAPWYAKRFGPAKPFKQRIITIRSQADFDAAVAGYVAWRAQFCDEHGELLPRFTPAPMVASFMRDEPDEAAGLHRSAIPVPKGPVDTW